ncbi:MAG: hypothetical protein GWO16_01435 [Gammaproteobacteria bacterium]|nr:hypothetical protein [Gammaproteobacteria bacterium]NIR96793.1 hypothetical protein [Gammaproteobacteria bacterium]NIT62493.1 hypothetical protein [Gammaproteobacteria bacterium]NIV19433.1 hypothetical protein [Gammaproteobacteria bacterium]NIX10516.1 hypothetical protein [Gammaproteobacteria bacterium]
MARSAYTGAGGGSGALRSAQRAKSRSDRLRQAMARRRLEEYREQKLLRERISDVFGDER